MHAASLFRTTIALGLALGAAGAAMAAERPPVEPGLWQVRMNTEVDGEKMPDMAEAMKNVPPAMRKQMEEMMKQRGVDTGGGGTGQRICQTRESLDSSRWADPQGRCITEITSRSGNVWKWRSKCTSPESESEGETTFADAKNYAVNARTRTNVGGQMRNANTRITAKWLGADCGDVKPVRVPAGN